AVLCQDVERWFGCPVTANAVLTPAGAQGFDVHFDYQDVFIVQLAGAKSWRIYEPVVALPLPEQFRSPLDRTRLGAPPLAVELHPGDLLFVPRGFPHEAVAGGSDSLQIGVGVHPFRVAELLREAMNDLAQRDVTLRRALEPGVLAFDRTEHLARDLAR